MTYYVRLLSPSEKIVPFNEILNQGNSVRLVTGTDALWDKIEVYEPADQLISSIERHPVSSGSPGETDLTMIKDSAQGCYPVNAREWLKKYFSGVKTIYSFQLFGDYITKGGWPVLGRIQNLLRDTLGGIIQADKEGFYNEAGDYILWQMYEGACGTIPAATLDERGEWISYQLVLNNATAIEGFKEGIVPKKRLLGKLFGR